MTKSFLPQSTKQFCNELLDLHKALKVYLVILIQETPRSHLSLLGLILLLGFSLRLSHLQQPIRYDEAMTYVYYASQPITYGMSHYFNPNNHPLNTLSIHLSTALFGNHEWTIRLPAFLAGNLLILAVYLAGRTLFSSKEGFFVGSVSQADCDSISQVACDSHSQADCGSIVSLVAAGWVASSSCLIGYSCNGRGYIFVCLFTILCAIFAKNLPIEPKFSDGLPLIIFGALGAWSIPTMALPFGGLILWLLYHRRDRKEILLIALMTTLLVGLFYLPIFATSGLAALTSNPFVSAQDGVSYGQTLQSGLKNLFSLWHRDLPMPFTIIFVLGFLMAHKEWSKTNIFHFALLATLAFSLSRQVFPYLRVWSFLLPLYLLISAQGFYIVLAKTLGFFTIGNKLSQIKKLIFVALLTLPLFFFVFKSSAIRDSEETGLFKSARAVAHIVKTSVFKNDRVLAWRPADMPLLYYLLKMKKSPLYLISDVSAEEKVSQQLRKMKKGARLMIVVKEPRQTISQVLDATGFPKEKFAPVQLLKKVNSANLYGTLCLRD